MDVEEPAARRIRVKVFTTDRLVTGYLHVPVTGYRTRVSDLMNQEGIEFLPITDATLYAADSSEALSTSRCIILNKHLIHLLVPDDELEGGGVAPPSAGGAA